MEPESLQSLQELLPIAGKLGVTCAKKWKVENALVRKCCLNSIILGDFIPLLEKYPTLFCLRNPHEFQ